MGWWKDANEAEDPDKFVKDLKSIKNGVKTLGKAVRDEQREDKQRRRDGRGR